MTNGNTNAIEAIKQMIKDGHVSQDVAEKYFPELMDKNNRMIKAAVEFVRQNNSFDCCLGVRKEEVIGWLESPSIGEYWEGYRDAMIIHKKDNNWSEDDELWHIRNSVNNGKSQDECETTEWLRSIKNIIKKNMKLNAENIHDDIDDNSHHLFKIGDKVLYHGIGYEKYYTIVDINKRGYYVNCGDVPSGIIPFNEESCMILEK